MIKSKNHDFLHNFKNIKAGPSFFTPKARLAFIKLRQAFIKIPIIYHFDLKCYFWIEINIFRYGISKILSQLILNNLG